MWIYKQPTGWIIEPNSTRLSMGYAGFAEGKNNPSMQNIHDVGPIPVGLYTMVSLIDTADHGPDVIVLEPDSDNEMFGRSGFLIHGDSLQHPGEASKGCIIAPRVTRLIMWRSQDHRLQVEAIA